MELPPMNPRTFKGLEAFLDSDFGQVEAIPARCEIRHARRSFPMQHGGRTWPVSFGGYELTCNHHGVLNWAIVRRLLEDEERAHLANHHGGVA